MCITCCHKVTKNNIAQEDQDRIFLLPIELSAVITHLFPVGLTDVGATATFLLLLTSPHDKQEED